MTKSCDRWSFSLRSRLFWRGHWHWFPFKKAKKNFFKKSYLWKTKSLDRKPNKANILRLFHILHWPHRMASKRYLKGGREKTLRFIKKKLRRSRTYVPMAFFSSSLQQPTLDGFNEPFCFFTFKAENRTRGGWVKSNIITFVLSQCVHFKQ